MMECFLCLEQKADKVECIEFRSSVWDELGVETVMEKHLWPIAVFKTEPQWLCMTCWRLLQEFHQFYKRIEDTHINFELVIKCESEEKSLTMADNVCYDTLSANLAEPEIELECEEFIALVKEEENEDCSSGKYSDLDDEDNIPLIHISRKSSNICLGERIIKTNVESSDDPLIRPVNLRPMKSKKRKPKKDLNQEVSNADISNQEDVDQRLLNQKFHITNGPLILKNNDNNSSPSYFYQSTISCSQYNSFIAEHFKISCHKCQLPFGLFSELQEHFRENHIGRAYVVCCKTKFYDRSLLVDHINLHINPDYFKCKHCPKVLSLRRNFNIHMKCHDKPLSCDICGKKFERKCFLNYHRQTHMSKEEKKIPCPDCDKFFASQYLLKNHRRVIHLKKYAKLCNICGQSLLNLESFKRHMKLHEGKEGPKLNCEICGLLVSSERYLKAHMKTKHPVGGNAEKVCPICLKVLQHSDGLRHHIRRNHNTGYIHKCSICDKAFKRVDHFKAHMNIHTGADKSKCPWCPRTFNANSSMHHHRKSAHPKEWEEARRKKFCNEIITTNTTETIDSTNSQQSNYTSLESKCTS